MNRTIVPVASVRVGNKINRRGVSVALAAIAVGIAVPVAMLRAADEKPGTPVQQQESPQPKGKEALALFKVWQDGARANGIEWTTIPRVVACRLAPGEFLEVIGAGIGVGPLRDTEDWQNTRVGSWVEAKEGDTVTFTPAPVSATGNFTDERAQGEPGWWLGFI